MSDHKPGCNWKGVYYHLCDNDYCENCMKQTHLCKCEKTTNILRETKCPNCKGSGISSFGIKNPCRKCNGLGTVLNRLKKI